MDQNINPTQKQGVTKAKAIPNKIDLTGFKVIAHPTGFMISDKRGHSEIVQAWAYSPIDPNIAPIPISAFDIHFHATDQALITPEGYVLLGYGTKDEKLIGDIFDWMKYTSGFDVNSNRRGKPCKS